MYTFKELQNIIEDNLSKIDLDISPIELYEPIKYTLSAGGKRVRPTLTLAACNLFSEDIEKSIKPALALEVFHNFTLLHDDIMDKAELRRNSATVHEKWNENIAILSGDAMSIKAYELLSDTEENHLKSVLKIFNKMAIQICEGQQFDMNFEEKNDVSEDEYLEMIKLKTSVLLATSLKIGAIVGGANENDAQNLYDFGLNLGLAFQLQDDFLDVYGDVNTFGKKIGGDIIANKKTFMLIKALEIADIETKLKINEILNLKEFDKNFKIKSIVDIYNKLEISYLAKNKMDYFYKKALNSFDLVNVEASKKEILFNFASNLMNRNN
ncbi:MAG: polyprenyl synthetase family protein [Bacteroidales bacterium]|nr:polyprenyl synthetase family protein [Bacteroidales bacterium]MBN2756713.1 polyprenyl synthetase family protein [Bacteroidales bacterium]